MPNYEYKNGYIIFKNQKINIIQYPLGKELSNSEGTIKDINEYSYSFSHLCSTESGSSGSPIFLDNSPYVIGIHKQGSKKENYGNFIGPIVDSLKNNYLYGE